MKNPQIIYCLTETMTETIGSQSNCRPRVLALARYRDETETASRTDLLPSSAISFLDYCAPRAPFLQFENVTRK